MPRKLMVLAILAIILLPSACSKDAADLERYLNCAAVKKVDIALVFDTSNSMGGEINELKALANKFASDLEASNIDYGLGLVEFRDFPLTCGESQRSQCGSPGDLPYRAAENGAITSDIRIFSSWLKEIKAGGGGEVGPEAVLAALRHADSDLLWRDDAERVIIALTDAGPHPDGSCCNAEGDTLEGTISALADEGTKAYIIGPDHPSLKKIASETGGQFYEIRSGLSLRPLLEEIAQAMSCRFNVETDARCRNKTLEARVVLVGNESIPYSAGRTEAWMYIEQEGETSRYNLSYNKSDGAYGAEVPDVCGPLNLTVYGRVEERSAVNTTLVDCEPCQSNLEQASLTISGLIFDDDNGNAAREASESGLEGWEIRLERPDGSLDAAKTDEKGFYAFTGLLPDRYKLSAIAPMNWTATIPENGTRIVMLDAGSKPEVNFGFRMATANQTSPMANLTEPGPESQARSWDKTYGEPGHDWGEAVEQTNDGGYIITGTSERTGSSGEGKGDIWLVKTDGNGTILWEKSFGGPEWDDGYSVVQTREGGYAITGSYGGDLRLIRTDENGSELWNKTFGGQREDWGEAVVQTGDEGFIIAGGTDRISSSVAGTGDLYLIKTDKNGSKIWDINLGESGSDWGRSVQQTSDGGYIVTGLLDDKYLWLIKFDGNGSKLWERTFAGAGRAEGYSVQPIAEGGYIVAGLTASLSGNLNEDLLLIKYDERGNKLWDKSYGGSDRDWGESIQQKDDGGFIIAGVTNSSDGGGGDVWLVRTDRNGTMLWKRSYGGANRDWGRSVQLTDDGGYIIAGLRESLGADQEGYEDLWLIKTDEKGGIAEEEKN
ncbi:MAG: VWA domain-containing protein [Methanothrix sp.]|nr:VWA domain-containing protein [Methanothrix sp.]